MKGWLVVSVLVAVAAVGTSTTTPDAGPEDTGTPVVVDTAVGPQPGNADVGLDADGLPPRIEYRGDLAHGCDDEGRALDVEPDTEEAWAAAERRCTRMHTAIEQAPWPGGMRP